MKIDLARLKEISEQLEAQTGKVCVYALWADAGVNDSAVWHQAIARKLGLHYSVIERHIIYDPTGDYGFVLAPKEVAEWDGDFDDDDDEDFQEPDVDEPEDWDSLLEDADLDPLWEDDPCP